MTDPPPPKAPKVTRARMTTSDVPPRVPRPKAVPRESADAAAVEAMAAEAPSPEPLMSIVETPAESPVRAEKVEITQGGATNVEADAVTVTQGGLTNVNARTVEVRQGGIAYAQAEDITVRMGGIALARADRVNVELGGVGVALAREVHLTQGAARSVVAQDVRIDQGLVGGMLAGRATFERPSGVLMLIAGRVEGPVKAVLDWRAALAFGAAFGLLWGIVRRR
jgi:hypothetical protein